MRNILFTANAQWDISLYTRRYREYYEELYRDSGIWAEDQIIDGYIRESITREDEIYRAILDRLSVKYDIIDPTSQKIWVRWRSKYVFIDWVDREDDRIITHIEIR